MSIYVISKQGFEFLNTPVFCAGADGEQEAVAAFTTRANAERYLEQAGWAESEEIGELDDLQLLTWVAKAHDQGIHYLVVDPTRASQLAGRSQQIIVIKEIMAGCAEQLTRDISELAH